MNSKKDPFIAYLDAAGFALPEIETYLSKHKKKAAGPPNIYEARERGREHCQTDGSDHYMLPGWSHSRGAKMEHMAAKALGLEILGEPS